MKRKFNPGFIWILLVFLPVLAFAQDRSLIVEDFGKDKYGSPLFFPNSKEWREAKGIKK